MVRLLSDSSDLRIGTPRLRLAPLNESLTLWDLDSLVAIGSQSPSGLFRRTSQMKWSQLVNSLLFKIHFRCWELEKERIYQLLRNAAIWHIQRALPWDRHRSSPLELDKSYPYDPFPAPRWWSWAEVQKRSNDKVGLWRSKYRLGSQYPWEKRCKRYNFW